MADIKTLADKRGTLLLFDPAKLFVQEGLNSRDLSTPDNVEHIKWLSEDIARHGVKQPLTIFQEDGKAYVADGHCRLEAIKLAIKHGVTIAGVPCIVEQRGTNEAERVLNQLVYNSGKQFNPMEKARALKRAIDIGMTTKEVAHQTGLSVSYVNQQIAFLAAPHEVHQMVAKGEVSASMAAKTIRKRGKREGTEALREAVHNAKEKGERKATASNLKATDEIWERVKVWVRQNDKRPKGVKDATLLEALVLLGEP